MCEMLNDNLKYKLKIHRNDKEVKKHKNSKNIMKTQSYVSETKITIVFFGII